MAKETLMDMVIAEIPADERVLKDGILNVLRIVSGKRRRSAFKYALTEKGVWMRNKKVLWFKPKTTFLAYADIAYYKRTKLFMTETLMFFPKSGIKPGNHIWFDDLPGAEAILSRYIECRK